jgi:hypothetical protein
VRFDPESNAVEVVSRAANTETTLTAFFKANKKEAEQAAEDPYNAPTIARNCLYQEFPQKFTWDARNKAWKVRQKGGAVGRMYYVPPTAGPKFYLRLLLTVVCGAISFEDLRTFEGTVYPSF